MARNYRFIESKNYEAIVFTKFENLHENENIKVVKITDDNPRVTLEQNLSFVNAFISV